MQEWVWLILGGLTAAALLVLGHYVPVPIVNTQPRTEDPRTPRTAMGLLCRYAWGVGAILAGFCVARLPLGDWQTPLMLGAVILSGGLATLACYGWDRVITALTRERMAGDD